MPTDATLLAVGVEGRGIKETDRDLEHLTQTAEKSERAATSQGAAWSRSGDVVTRQMAAMSQSVRAQADNMVALSDQTQRVLDRYDPLGSKIRALQADFARLNAEVAKGAGAGQESAIDKTYAKLNEEIAKTQSLMAAAGAASAEGFGKMEKGGIAAALSTARARQELVVLGHEALQGNFSRMPGSFMVLGEQAARSGVAILGVAAAIAAPLAALALLALAYHKGAEEAAEFNAAIFKSGNFAGTTRGEMLDLAKSIAMTGDVSLSTAKAFVVDLVGSGKLGAESLRSVSSLVADYARATHGDVEKIGAELLKVFEDPAKGAEKLNDSMHFLSIADLRYIEELQAMGRAEEARLVLADRLREKLDTTPQQLGFLETAWNKVKVAASNAWDAMLNIGRGTSDEQKLREQIDLVASLQNRLDEQTARGRGTDGTQAKVDAARAYLATLLDQYGAQKNVNDAQAQASQLNQRLSEDQKLLEQSTTAQVRSIDIKIARLKEDHDALIAAGASEQDYASKLQDLGRQRDSLLNKGSRVDPFDRGLAEAVKILTDAQRESAEFGQTLDTKTSPAMKRLIDLLGDPAFLKYPAAKRAEIQETLLAADAIQHDTAARKQAQAATDALSRAIGASVGNLSKEQAALDQQLESLRTFGTSTEHATEAATEWDLANGKLAVTMVALSLGLTGASEAFAAMQIAMARGVDQTRHAFDATKALLEADKEAAQAIEAKTAKINEQADKLNEQAAALGLTKQQQDALKIAETAAALATAEHTLEILRQTDANNADIPAVEARIEALKKLGDAQKNVLDAQVIADQKKGWEDLWKTAEQGGANFITDFIEHGSSAFKNLWENFKHWAIEAFAKIAAQQIIVNIAGSFGGVAGSAASSLSGGGGGLGSIFNMMGGGGGGALAGIGGWLSGMGGAIGAFGSTLGAGFSAGIATLGIAAEAGTAAIGGLASAMGAMAAVAIPVVGWIAAIGIALYAAFGQKGGGPKSGGFAQSGAGVMIGGDNNRYFTPNQSDADIQKATDQLLTSYNGILTALGGKGQAGFALGYDSDPKGTAPNRVSSGAFVNGQQVYGTHDVGVGRDADQLQAALALEGKRVVLAALQASDLPEYLSKILDSVKVDTASSAAIDQVLAEAAALKAAVDVFGQLGDQFNKLDPDQIKGLLDAFGGIDNFTKAFQYLNDNFLTTADKHATDVKNLTDAFTSLGMQVPKDHQAYLDLLNAQDLSTDAGRQLYAQLVALAPAFVAVAGTAEQAAQALRQQVQAAEQVFNQSFFTQQERDAQAATTAWDQVHQAWAENAIALHALGFDHIPTTTAGFRQLIGSIDRSTAAGEALYQSMIVLAPGIVSINTAVGDLSDTSATAGTVISNAADQISQHISDLQDAAGKAQTAFSAILSAIDDVSNSGTGDFGDKLTTKITLLREQSDKYQALLAAQLNGPDPYGVLAVAYRNMLQQLSGLQSTATDQLTRFTILKAQYGGAIAEQLVQLQDWYKTQQALFGGNVDALSALQTVFDQKWKAIVDGTGNAVNQASDQMAKLRQSILDYVKGLQVSDISPLTPAQKLAQAQQQYNDRLHQAQGGNTDAMGDITRYSDTYLHIARDFFASSSAYTDIFGAVTRQLTALGSPTNGTVMPDAQTKLASALPDAGGKLASQDDLKQLAAVVEQMGATVRDAVVGSSPKAKIGALQRSLETTVTK
jgi:hypothetical protein